MKDLISAKKQKKAKILLSARMQRESANFVLQGGQFSALFCLLWCSFGLFFHNLGTQFQRSSGVKLGPQMKS